MSKYSKNSKESASKEIDTTVNEDAGRKLKGKSKKTEGSRLKTSSYAEASKAGRISVAKMKKLKKIQDPTFDIDSDADEFDWMNFLKRHAYFPK